MSVKTFNVSFPEALADQIDQKAKKQFGNRSDFLRAAAIKYLREEEKIEQFKELVAYGKKFAKNSAFKTEEEVAEYITRERRKKEPWRQDISKFKSRT